MTDQQADQLIDNWYEQQLVQYEEMMNEEPPCEEEVEEESIFYASNPYTTKGAKWKRWKLIQQALITTSYVIFMIAWYQA